MTLNAVIFVLTVFFSGSHQQCFSTNDTAPLPDVYTQYSWQSHRLDFGISLFQAVIKESSKRNVIFSPSSVHRVLLLAYFGAAHETEESLAKVLRISSKRGKSEAWRFYRTERLENSARENNSHPMKVANKIYFSNDLKLRPCIQENLRVETEMINYKTNTEWAVNYINNWVANVTEGEIKDAIKGLDPTCSATLVNAVFFKAKWLHGFNPKFTEKLPFRVNSKKSKTTNMMVKTDDFATDYLQDLKVHLLKLPYQGGNQAMIILLPDNDLDAMIQSLSSDVIKRITRSNILKKSSHVKVIIPKYKGKSRIDLSLVLEKLGIGNALFTSADFSRFTGRKEIIFDDAYQEAKIEVDEEGTKASAVSVVGGGYSAILHPPEPFICDRPFAYIIFDYVANEILFMGTFREPDL